MSCFACSGYVMAAPPNCRARQVKGTKRASGATGAVPRSLPLEMDAPRRAVRTGTERHGAGQWIECWF